MSVIIILRRDDWLHIGGHFDVAILGTDVQQGDTAAFGIMLGGNDALDHALQIANGLVELGLVIGEDRLGLFTLDDTRLRRRTPPLSIGGIAQEDEGTPPIVGRIRLPAEIACPFHFE